MEYIRTESGRIVKMEDVKDYVVFCTNCHKGGMFSEEDFLTLVKAAKDKETNVLTYIDEKVRCCAKPDHYWVF